MDLSIYAGTHKFRQPYLSRVQSVSGLSVLWALLTGPGYFWRKGARIEAMLLALVSVPPLVADREHSLIDPSVLSAFASLTWAGAALCAPLILSYCYRRQGWVEVCPAAELFNNAVTGVMHAGWRRSSDDI
jgi:hypothetical protein